MKKINLIFNGYNNGKNLLYFIKTIKEATGMGLKESKDFCDDVYCQYEKTIQPVNREIYLNNDFTEKGEPLEKWLERILNRDVGRFSVMYKEKQRQKIILDLELGEILDYVEYISEDISHKVINRDIGNIKDIIFNLVSKIDKEEILKLYKSLNNEI
jgi:hypothetical protein